MNCTMRIIRLRELYYACSTIFLGKCAARPGGSSGRPTPTEALQGVRCVVGGRTEASAPTEGCMKCLRAGRCGHRPLRRALHEVRWGGASGTPPPTESYHGVRRGGALLPTVVPTDSRALSCPPIGALPRNRLASSATGGASPISPPAGDRKGRPYGGLQEVR